MNQERADFKTTPAYDDFLETREDLINRFIDLYDTVGSSSTRDGTATREELEKILHKFEIENQESIIHTRSTADDRKRRKFEHIIEVEGTMYERINVDYNERSSVTDHELAVQHPDILSKMGDADGKFHQHASADLINRRARLIPQPTPPTSLIIPVPVIAEASGCRELWKARAVDVIKHSFRLIG